MSRYPTVAKKRPYRHIPGAYSQGIERYNTGADLDNAASHWMSGDEKWSAFHGWLDAEAANRLGKFYDKFSSIFGVEL